MKTRLISILALAGFVFISGCGAAGVTKQGGGAVLGGAAGGALGAQVGQGKGRTAAIIAGTIIGALIGGSVGSSLDKADNMHMQSALERSPVNQPVSWYNPDTRAHYEVTPTRTFYTANQKPCRDFTTVAMIDGKRETVQGTACRQSNGVWQSQ